MCPCMPTLVQVPARQGRVDTRTTHRFAGAVINVDREVSPESAVSVRGSGDGTCGSQTTPTVSASMCGDDTISVLVDQDRKPGEFLGTSVSIVGGTKGGYCFQEIAWGSNFPRITV